MKNNRKLFDQFFSHEELEKPELANVYSALVSTDRKFYCPWTFCAYENSPKHLHKNATISAPVIHAQMAKLVASHLVPGSKVLDIGCGSGFMSAVFARAIGPTGKVIAVELIQELCHTARNNIQVDFASSQSAPTDTKSASNSIEPQVLTPERPQSRNILDPLPDSSLDLSSDNGKDSPYMPHIKSYLGFDPSQISIIHANASLGYMPDGPYNVIHIGASTPRSSLDHLQKQLKPNGLLVAPVNIDSDKDTQRLLTMSADSQCTPVPGYVKFVPLLNSHLS